MKNPLTRQLLPHAIAILVMLVICLAYFYPTLEGKVLQQSDIINWTGMAKEIKDYRSATGENTLWTNSMFGGMPAYQIDMPSSSNWVNKLRVLLIVLFIEVHERRCEIVCIASNSSGISPGGDNVYLSVFSSCLDIVPVLVAGVHEILDG